MKVQPFVCWLRALSVRPVNAAICPPGTGRCIQLKCASPGGAAIQRLNTG